MEDNLQDNIHNVTNAAYNFALANGCSAEQIYYLAPDTDLDADGDGEADVDKAATNANLQYVLTQWAASKVAADRALTIFLMDHGAYDRLYLDEPNGERVTPQELNDWLTQLERVVPGVPINIVVDACHSGSFIDPVNKVSQGGRVVIASTAPYALANASRRGAAFSDAFLSALSLGKGLRDAFQESTWAVTAAHPGQVPWLDDTGEGISNATDGAVAARRAFACGEAPAPTRWAPRIIQGEVRPVGGGRGEVWAEIWEDGDIYEVWAVVYAPSYVPPETGDEMVPEPLHTTLHHRDAAWYAGLYGALDEVGLYRVVLYATDTEGLHARPQEIFTSVGGTSQRPDENVHLQIPIGGYTATVDVPARAVTETTTFTYTGFTDLTGLPSLSGFDFAGRGFTLTAYQRGALQPRFTFQRPITITITYSDADVDGIDEDTLALYWLDGTTWRVDDLPVFKRDQNANQLIVTATHLTQFALFGKVDASNPNYAVYLPVVLRK